MEKTAEALLRAQPRDFLVLDRCLIVTRLPSQANELAFILLKGEYASNGMLLTVKVEVVETEEKWDYGWNTPVGKLFQQLLTRQKGQK